MIEFIKYLTSDFTGFIAFICCVAIVSVSGRHILEGLTKITIKLEKTEGES